MFEIIRSFIRQRTAQHLGNWVDILFRNHRHTDQIMIAPVCLQSAGDHWGNGITGCHVLSLSSLSTPPPGSGHSSDTIFIYDESVSPGTHSLLYSSEHQSIKNLRPFSQVLKEGGKFAGARISRQLSACQIPFDAELMAPASQAGAV